MDIIEDFSEDLVTELVKLSEQLDFLIFEDRKFADIGKLLFLMSSSTFIRGQVTHLSLALLYPLYLCYTLILSSRKHRRTPVLFRSPSPIHLGTPNKRPPHPGRRYNNRSLLHRFTSRSRTSPLSRNVLKGKLGIRFTWIYKSYSRNGS